MISLLRQINRTATDLNVIRKALSYETHSQGIRTPYGPGGVIVFKDATTQNYSGQNKVTTSVTGGTTIEGSKLSIQTQEVSINPFSLHNFQLKGKSFNEGIFYGTELLVAIANFTSFYNAQVIVDTTEVVNGKIVGAKPLSSLLKTTELFIKEEQIEPLEVEILRIIKGAL